MKKVVLIIFVFLALIVGQKAEALFGLSLSCADSSDSDCIESKNSFNGQLITEPVLINEGVAAQGSDSSCGYHALKNCWLLYLDYIKNTGECRTLLQDTDIVERYYGSPSGEWRVLILERRRFKMFENDIKEKLRTQVKSVLFNTSDRRDIVFCKMEDICDNFVAHLLKTQLHAMYQNALNNEEKTYDFSDALQQYFSTLTPNIESDSKEMQQAKQEIKKIVKRDMRIVLSCNKSMLKNDAYKGDLVNSGELEMLAQHLNTLCPISVIDNPSEIGEYPELFGDQFINIRKNFAEKHEYVHAFILGDMKQKKQSSGHWRSLFVAKRYGQIIVVHADSCNQPIYANNSDLKNLLGALGISSVTLCSESEKNTVIKRFNISNNEVIKKNKDTILRAMQASIAACHESGNNLGPYQGYAIQNRFLPPYKRIH